MAYTETQYANNSAGMLLSGESLILDENIDPYIIIIDRNTPSVNYSVMKQHRVIGVLIEAGSLYSIAHTEQHYQSPSLKSQVAAAIQNNMPYGLYATVRSRSVTEAKKELYELSLIIRTYLPLLGVWLQIQFTSGVSTNDSIMDEYYRQLVDIGMQGQIGVYASRNQLNKITWDNYCNEIFLLLDEHVDSMNDINQLLTPEFFSL